MRLLRAVSRAVERFNRWFGTTAAASSSLHADRVGTYVDPAALQMLTSEMERGAAGDEQAR
ncbi:MAG TPA: hypothetical protein VFA05_09750 [Gaiellaceae bacterium]|nr:hypothetical protein [Gaiellaceae bacterium]